MSHGLFDPHAARGELAVGHAVGTEREERRVPVRWDYRGRYRDIHGKNSLASIDAVDDRF